MKHVYQIGLKLVAGGGHVIPAKGIVAEDREGSRASDLAENAMFATIPFDEQDKYVADVRYLGPVDIDASAGADGQHYFQIGLRHVSGANYIPTKGVTAAANKEKGLRASQVAADAVFATLPEGERAKYVVGANQHLSAVDIEA